MWNFLSQLTAPIAGAVTKWNEGRVKIAEAKINAKVARYNAEAARATKAIDAETNWDLAALEASKDSWKDEWLTLLLSMPFIGSFIPGIQDAVLKGWEYVAKAPTWYQIAFLGIVAASFGLRWWFNQQKLGALGGN